MIQETKRIVEETYCISKGCKYDAEVIYGDTDSVMVKVIAACCHCVTRLILFFSLFDQFGTDDLEEAMTLGKEAAKLVTQRFVRPINLDFEKVFFTLNAPSACLPVSMFLFPFPFPFPFLFLLSLPFLSYFSFHSGVLSVPANQ